MSTQDHEHGLDPDLPLLTTTVEKVVQWARRSAIWPAQFGLACCAIEMTHLGSGIWSYTRRIAGANFRDNRPATIMRSDCRGEPRKTSAPKRAIS